MAKEKSKNLVASFNDIHNIAIQKTEHLSDVVTNLRYEGKFSLGKNLKEIQKVIDFFSRHMKKHIQLEEEIIFPFLETHIPKLDSLTRLLCSEHKDFEKNFETLQFQLQTFSKVRTEPERGKAIEKLRDVGVYLAYLLRNHMQQENESVYKAIEKELRRNERKELEHQVAEFIASDELLVNRK